MSSNNKAQSFDSNGKEINPYIPKYITKAPWYAGSSNNKDYLSHQRTDPSKDVPESYKEPQHGMGIRDVFVNVSDDRNDFGPILKKKKKRFLPGACSNCGSMAHKKIDCVERPRKVGALYNNDKSKSKMENGPTESFVVKQNEDYDSKRDRWHGYDVAHWDEVVKNWDTIKASKELAKGDDDGDDTDYELELTELGLHKRDIMENVKEDPNEKILRDRNDVPEYLKNVKDNVSDTGTNIKTKLNKEIGSDIINDLNQFEKLSGDAAEFTKLRRFAWEADNNNQSEDVNLNLNPDASPTAVSLAAKKAKEKAGLAMKAKRNDLLAKYGGAQYLTDSNKDS